MEKEPKFEKKEEFDLIGEFDKLTEELKETEERYSVAVIGKYWEKIHDVRYEERKKAREGKTDEELVKIEGETPGPESMIYLPEKGSAFRTMVMALDGRSIVNLFHTAPGLWHTYKFLGKSETEQILKESIQENDEKTEDGVSNRKYYEDILKKISEK